MSARRPTAAWRLIPLFGAALLLAFGCARAEEKKLFIYNWADFIGTATIARFEKETGIKVGLRHLRFRGHHGGAVAGRRLRL